MAAPTDLSPNDRLTYLIGDIVRSDAFAENEARGVWSVLAGSPEATRVMPRDFARIVEDCRAMLKNSNLDNYILELCREVLTVAGEAHAERSVLAHDQWMQHLPDDLQWHSVRALSSPKQLKSKRPLHDFEQCRDQLTRVGWRLRALWIVVPQWFGEPGPLDDLDEADRVWWTSIAKGTFEFAETGIKANPVDVPNVIARRPRSRAMPSNER